MERQHALNTARNVLNSKIAKTLLEENKLPDRHLQIQVERFKADERRNLALTDNQQRLFKKQGLIYNFNPTIVVERPASLRNPTKDGSTTPHYMTDIKQKQSLPIYSPLPKVDAFKVISKRKRNLWEQNYDVKGLSKQFRSIILNSPPLTSDEQCDLDKGWTLYRPVSRLEESMQQLLASKTKTRRQLAKSVKLKISSPNVFITQLALDENTTPKPSDKSNTATSNYLHDRLRETAIGQSSEKRLQQFQQMRERQRRAYHQYLR
ncbi:uncharacterized protein [Watersipora subatra]|uniref:uncharacterized protein n=1 Tax=Watersipora subatra TaxID=2589382 RepID=UPI00355C7170